MGKCLCKITMRSNLKKEILYEHILVLAKLTLYLMSLNEVFTCSRHLFNRELQVSAPLMASNGIAIYSLPDLFRHNYKYIVQALQM